MKTHLFKSDCEGSLYDTRVANWHEKPALRPVYSRHFAAIKTTHELKATLRAGGFAWPGGYPLYFITSDGDALSFEALKDKNTLRAVLSSVRYGRNDGWRIVACEVNWEDNELECVDTMKRIPSAYAET
jgi:hypothetical protein